MSFAYRRWSSALSLILVGCIPTPGFELPSATSDDPFETDGPYEPELPDSDGSGDGAGSSSDDAGGSSGDVDDPSGPWDPSDTTSGGGETTSGGDPTVDPTLDSGSTSDGETSGTDPTDPTTDGDPQPAFPPAEPFGDDAAETGLAGTWTVAWNPDGTPHWSLDIAGDGAFTWSEAAASCSSTAVASGVLWVEGNQLVLHVETWDKRDPWPVESVVGAPLEVPFRLHLDYAMALGMLSVSGPWELTAMLGWEGRVYRRESGSGPAGTFSTQASLEAILPGEDTPRTIVRDTYTMETAGGAQAYETTQRTWLHGDAPVEQPEVVENAVWFNLTPGQPQGMISIGGISHLYDAERLVAYDETRVFSEEAPAGCD